MAYFLEFDERALREWRKLGSTVREQLKKKLAEVLDSPRIEAHKLRGMPDCYKIKLKSSGYRLVYQVIDEKVVVFVIAVGRREKKEVYAEAVKRLL
jgi:mRNA interferase RelE/StbE